MPARTERAAEAPSTPVPAARTSPTVRAPTVATDRRGTPRTGARPPRPLRIVVPLEVTSEAARPAAPATARSSPTAVRARPAGGAVAGAAWRIASRGATRLTSVP